MGVPFNTLGEKGGLNIHVSRSMVHRWMVVSGWTEELGWINAVVGPSPQKRLIVAIPWMLSVKMLTPVKYTSMWVETGLSVWSSTLTGQEK